MAVTPLSDSPPSSVRRLQKWGWGCLAWRGRSGSAGKQHRVAAAAAEKGTGERGRPHFGEERQIFGHSPYSQWLATGCCCRGVSCPSSVSAPQNRPALHSHHHSAPAQGSEGSSNLQGVIWLRSGGDHCPTPPQGLLYLGAQRLSPDSGEPGGETGQAGPCAGGAGQPGWPGAARPPDHVPEKPWCAPGWRGAGRPAPAGSALRGPPSLPRFGVPGGCSAADPALKGGGLPRVLGRGPSGGEVCWGGPSPVRDRGSAGARR